MMLICTSENWRLCQSQTKLGVKVIHTYSNHPLATEFNCVQFNNMLLSHKEQWRKAGMTKELFTKSALDFSTNQPWPDNVQHPSSDCPSNILTSLVLGHSTFLYTENIRSQPPHLEIRVLAFGDRDRLDRKIHMHTHTHTHTYRVPTRLGVTHTHTHTHTHTYRVPTRLGVTHTNTHTLTGHQPDWVWDRQTNTEY